ncbi:MAG: hypothetical protein AAGE65_08590 [Planctomycetota bacterium]
MKILTSTDPPTFLDLDAPTVAAHFVKCPDTDGLLWLVECPYCEEHHYHGPQEGHRHAHWIASAAESMRGDDIALADAWQKVAAAGD